MNYTINQLRIFLKVSQTKSLTKAAEELYMTQPAVSIQLKNFQNQFGVPLTELIGRRIFITDFGMEVANYAKNILEKIDELKFKTKEFEGILTGNLKISSASTGKYVIPFFLSGFLEKFENIDLKLDVTNKARVIESLKQNEVDFAIISVIPEDIEVYEEKLIENKLFLVGNKYNYKSKMPLIFREEGSATRMAMEGFLNTKKTSGKRIELTSNEAVKQAVIAGIGHSILPAIGIQNQLLDGSLKVIPKRGLPIKTQWRLVWLKNKNLSPVAEAYLNFVRESKNEIQEKYFRWSDEV